MRHENRIKKTQIFGNRCVSSENNKFFNGYSNTNSLLGGKYDLAALKQSLDKNAVVAILLFIGYDIDKRGKFRLRPEEMTVSASVDRMGKITDFGSGWRNDIFALLQEYHGLTFPEAVS